MSFHVVPGNIKQQALPFVLNPEMEINKANGEYDTQKGSHAPPQVFTFRAEDAVKHNGVKSGILNFCPTAVKKNINNDISMKLIYDSNVTDPDKQSKNKFTYNNLVKTLPALQIREFLPDTALDQCINFFTDLISSFSKLFGKDGLTSSDQKDENGKTIDASSDKFDIGKFANKLLNVVWFAVKYLSGLGSPNIVTSAMTADVSKLYKGSGIYKTDPNSIEDKMLKFPYMLYYKFQSCTTTSIYEVPCLNVNNKHMYSSDGNPGWEDDAGFSLLPKQVSSLPLIGGLLGKMFGNMNVSFMPWWNAQKGNATKEPQIVVNFDLFNDSEEAAITNFIFVNTIVPNNKWLQYGLFQHSPHLYDIKLEGYNRLFACTGKFEVNYDGVLRDPPLNWYKENGPLKPHINANIERSKFLEALKNDKSIKIPDIQKVTLTFDSLLPANFNNYLYTLVNNQSSIKTYSDHSYDNSIVSDAMANAVKGFVDNVKKVWSGDNKTDYRENKKEEPKQ